MAQQPYSTYEKVLLGPRRIPCVLKITVENGGVVQWQSGLAARHTVDLQRAVTDNHAYVWISPVWEPGVGFDASLNEIPGALGVYDKITPLLRQRLAIPQPVVPTGVGDTYTVEPRFSTIAMTLWENDQASRWLLLENVEIPNLWVVKQIMDR